MSDAKPGECIDCGTHFQRKSPKGPMPKRCSLCTHAYQIHYKRKWIRDKYARDPSYRDWRKSYDKERREKDPEYNRMMTARWRIANPDKVKEYNDKRKKRFENA